MKTYSRRAITPVWAQRIEVERRKDALLITGWGHIPNPLSPQQVPSDQHSKLDILQGLRRYALRHLGQPREPAGIYQFADAADDEKLITFVKEFGPVAASLVKIHHEDNNNWTLKVRESLESLRREQKRFAEMVQILQQVNRGGHADLAVLRSLLLAFSQPSPKVRALQDIAKTGPKWAKNDDLIPMAHEDLCFELNHHQPKLVPIDGEVVELPNVDFTGIRDALYFQLRLDYLAQRTIGTCLNCGGHFTVFKRGTQGCRDTCRRALRNQRYWNKSKATINAERREKKTGRK